MILQLSQHSTSSTAVSWLAEEMNPPYHVSQKGKFPENRADIFATEASTLALPGEDAQNIIEIEILRNPRSMELGKRHKISSNPKPSCYR